MFVHQAVLRRVQCHGQQTKCAGDRLLKADERRIRARSDPLALPEDILYERYRFSSEAIRYLIVLVGPSVGNATKRSRALTVAQCVSLRCFAKGTYLHTVGDAENISKNTVPCDTRGCSCPKYTATYVRGVSQLFANTNCQGRILSTCRTGSLHVEKCDSILIMKCTLSGLDWTERDTSWYNMTLPCGAVHMDVMHYWRSPPVELWWNCNQNSQKPLRSENQSQRNTESCDFTQFQHGGALRSRLRSLLR
ncbi:hypothetical protein N1851_002289 [Merluccius polli]|uniref:Uncharacterized protein n=1 Tax=Merluccius polli TaxID=89951 RepID=A0AA47NAQ5_MERPO|nr:hypothetical protein N1851_002289 [Merluccius polli]